MNGKYIINGKNVELTFDSDAKLVSVLRDNGYMEVKCGCEKGHCGACAILLDNKLTLSCQVYAASAVGREITTVQGLGTVHNPHPIQTAFAESGAIQCGFCTPGKVLAAYALLSKNPNPTEEEIKAGIDGHICRCTGYVKIIEAIKLAAERMASNG